MVINLVLDCVRSMAAARPFCLKISNRFHLSALMVRTQCWVSLPLRHTAALNAESKCCPPRNKATPPKSNHYSTWYMYRGHAFMALHHIALCCHLEGKMEIFQCMCSTQSRNFYNPEIGLFHLIRVPPLWMIFRCLFQGILTC